MSRLCIHYRLEKRKWIQGRWVDKAGQRRRYYQLTTQGKKVLRAQRNNWKAFVAAISRIAGVSVNENRGSSPESKQPLAHSR